MALFLNTQKLNYWIPKLIKESKEELILIVPYIQTSTKVLSALKTADEKGVQIMLIYRENKLSDSEKQKFKTLKNINLLHHPNIHCKTYYNGNLLIIGSMNLYEYSEKNNREMGVLFNKERIHEDISGWYSCDDKIVFDDVILEMREIINGANLEKYSDKTKASAFNIDIIKTDVELEQEKCDIFNKYFLNKKFIPISTSSSICKNYYDKIDVTVDSFNDFEIKFNLDDEQLEAFHIEWEKQAHEFMFQNFWCKWFAPKNIFYLKRNYKANWELSEKQFFKTLKQGIDDVVLVYRKLN